MIRAQKTGLIACLTLLSFVSVIVPAGVLSSARAEAPIPQAAPYFPPEGSPGGSSAFFYPTIPNEELDFTDANESCCSRDMAGAARPAAGAASGSPPIQSAPQQGTKTAFEVAATQALAPEIPLVACEVYANLPELASNTAEAAPTHIDPVRSLPIKTHSSNVSIRKQAQFFSNPKVNNTDSFHISTRGGVSLVQLQDVTNYSVCMARGGNIAMVANTNNGSILTYNGSDHIYLAGHNTNMLTRTGEGEDIIELYQSRPHVPQVAMATPAKFQGENWEAYNIYKTAISGGEGTDTLVIRGTPTGTKWCHIGGYTIYGEYFHVVEFALPPSVTEGPRRQRVNIGQTVEYVVFKGRTYRLRDFLAHGQPMDNIARSVPVDGELR